jgi:type III restriction enzyme
VYEIAAEITERLKSKREEWSIRHILFPQVLNIVWQYLERARRCVDRTPATLEEVALD